MRNSNALALIIPTPIFTVLGFAAITARLVTRFKILRKWGWDEVAAIAAMVFSIALAIVSIGEATYGMGEYADTPKKLRDVLKFLWLSQIFYHASLASTKLAIILQYLRIFSGPRLQIACRTLLMVMILYAIATQLTCIWTCRPISAFWDLRVDADCFQIGGPLFFFHPAFNIVTDLILITLPLPVLYDLTLPRKQKIGLIVVFTLGGFVVIISIMRLLAIADSVETDNMSSSNTSIAMWSIIEVNTAIFCTSMTCIRPLLVRLFPGRFSRDHLSFTFTEQTITGIDTNVIQQRGSASVAQSRSPSATESYASINRDNLAGRDAMLGTNSPGHVIILETHNRNKNG